MRNEVNGMDIIDRINVAKKSLAEYKKEFLELIEDLEHARNKVTRTIIVKELKFREKEIERYTKEIPRLEKLSKRSIEGWVVTTEELYAI